MTPQTFSCDWAGRPLTIEVGRMAHQADASCTVRYGDTMVLATVVMSPEERTGIDFFPLMVDYEEKYYAAGKIKGSRFVKMEGRPSDRAVLTSRMIDRTVRPLFDDRLRNEIQMIVSVLSYDEENAADVVAMIGACAVAHLSKIPWHGPVAGVRVGLQNGTWVVNPSVQSTSEADMVVCGTTDRLIMMEAEAKQTADNIMVEGIAFGLKQLAPVLDLLEQVRRTVGVEKLTVGEQADAEVARIKDLSLPFITQKVEELFFSAPLATKTERGHAKHQIAEALKAYLVEQGVAEDMLMHGTRLIYGHVQRVISDQILASGRRVDGRSLTEIRALAADVGLLPRTHGSAVFSRGETQVLSTVTLAGPGAAQIIDTMDTDVKKDYMHHYAFPPFSVGEARPLRGPGRREIGHGALAEKALEPVLPTKEAFPYVMRVTSETMGSNGSSSMASTCGSTLALLDAGVPLQAPVAGVAIGLASTPDMSQWKVFTDLQDLEDGDGGMDFKIAGTATGVTAIQLDTKTQGLSMDIVHEAFAQAKQGRLEILDVIKKTIPAPRAELSKFAPRIESFTIKPDRIRDIIGPGGKMINEIIDETGVEIDIEDSGVVTITSKNVEGIKQAKEWIQSLVAEVEVGRTYQGTVTRLMEFGAFVEVLPKQEGLVHVSEMAPYRVNKVADIVKVGDRVFVKVTEVDSMGRTNLSMKQAEGNVFPPAPAQTGSGRPDDRGRGDRKPYSGPSRPPRRP